MKNQNTSLQNLQKSFLYLSPIVSISYLSHRIYSENCLLDMAKYKDFGNHIFHTTSESLVKFHLNLVFIGILLLK